MRDFHQKSPRILIGISEGEYYGHQFGALVRLMPNATYRFIGFSWCTGLELRRAGHDFRHSPWVRTRSSDSIGNPIISELIGRGGRPGANRNTVMDALVHLKAFVKEEIDDFSPDIVIYGPSDHAINYLLDTAANEAGIPRLGLQPSFLSDHFIVNPWGPRWQEAIQQAQIPEEGSPPGVEPKDLFIPRGFRSVPAPRPSLHFPQLLRGAECLARILTGRPTFETLSSLAASTKAKLAPAPWFPYLQTIESESDVPDGSILMVLNQPTLEAHATNCSDLIRLTTALAPKDTPVILRPHPIETPNDEFGHLESSLRERGVKVSRAGRGPSLSRLVERCRTLVTINSAVGMEALSHGKTVLALGPAFYVREGLAQAVDPSRPEKLADMLDHPEAYRPDPLQVAKFANWLIQRLMAPSPIIESPFGRTLAEHIRVAVQGHPVEAGRPPAAIRSPERKAE